VLESIHSALRQRVKVAHPNLFSFLGHLQRTTTDNQADIGRLNNGITIRRPKKRANIINDARIKGCTRRFDSKSYTRLQFLRAVSYSMGAHSDMLCVTLWIRTAAPTTTVTAMMSSVTLTAAVILKLPLIQKTQNISTTAAKFVSWCHANSASF